MAITPEDLQRRLRGYTINGEMFARISKKNVKLGKYQDGIFYPTAEAQAMMRSLMPDMALRGQNKPRMAAAHVDGNTPPPAPVPTPRAAAAKRGQAKKAGLPVAPVPPPHPPVAPQPATDYVVGQGLHGVNPDEFEDDAE